MPQASLNGAADSNSNTIFLSAQSVFYFDYGCVSFWNLTPKQVC